MQIKNKENQNLPPLFTTRQASLTETIWLGLLRDFKPRGHSDGSAHTSPHESPPGSAKTIPRCQEGNLVLTAMVEPWLQGVGRSLTPEEQKCVPPHLSEPDGHRVSTGPSKTEFRLGVTQQRHTGHGGRDSEEWQTQN